MSREEFENLFNPYRSDIHPEVAKRQALAEYDRLTDEVEELTGALDLANSLINKVQYDNLEKDKTIKELENRIREEAGEMCAGEIEHLEAEVEEKDKVIKELRSFIDTLKATYESGDLSSVFDAIRNHNHE